MLLTVAAFILVLGVLIFVHELGHFLAAKAVGIGVPRFSIGLGPATPLRFRRGETEYLLAWLPLGGYVKMASKEEQEAVEALEGGQIEEEYPPEKLFENKSVAARILVISAGVIMNALLAWVIYTGILAVLGQSQDPTTTLARVDTAMLPQAASELAEVPFGTRVEQLNGVEIDSWNAILEQVLDPTSPRLDFEFDGLAPITVDLPGTNAKGRSSLARALIPLWEARVGFLASGQPAEAAGLERGDLVVAIDGQSLRSWDDLVQMVETRAGEELQLQIDRDGEKIVFSVVPTENTIKDPLTGESRQVGRIGIGPLIEPVRVQFGLGEALVGGAQRAWRDATLVLATLKGMVLGQVSPRELGGPIFIGQASGQFARAGLVSLLSFMALLSVNLAVLNLLPIPVLDGGHLIFLVLEGLRGKPVPAELRHRLTSVGLYFLLMVMALALVNDLFRVVGG